MVSLHPFALFVTSFSWVVIIWGIYDRNIHIWRQTPFPIRPCQIHLPFPFCVNYLPTPFDSFLRPYNLYPQPSPFASFCNCIPWPYLIFPFPFLTFLPLPPFFLISTFFLNFLQSLPILLVLKLQYKTFHCQSTISFKAPSIGRWWPLAISEQHSDLDPLSNSSFDVYLFIRPLAFCLDN